MTLPQFPSDFVWGVSTSAFQIEGATSEDGRGPSVWDAFTSQPGRIKDGTTAERAADHYHRYREDIGLLAELGVTAYRFSISWPRVVPRGSGPLNQAGLDFYDRLVDELCAHGIEPTATLFHWDTPLALEESGGWQSRETADRLGEYVAKVAERLNDRVTRWVTINEPAEATLLGHAIGEHAPGRQLLFDALPVAHNLLLGHGRAVAALRAAGARQVGIAMSHTPVWPVEGTDEDAFGAELYDTLMNWLFADPVLTGAYPEGMAEMMTGLVSEDLTAISAPLDFYGVNYYTPTLVGAPLPGDPEAFAGIEIPTGLPFGIREIDGYPRTDFDWPVVPDGLRDVLLRLKDRYGDRLPPVFITENGCSYAESPHDSDRIAFHDAHLNALHQAMDEGVDVRGYFIWSFMDNFEWAEGHRQRFGLVHVDFTTMKRTPKDSFTWYRDLIRAQKAQKAQKD